ncbi:hypothetical protein [Coleofasciculus sp. FACHB-129]|nr:hypothetical protein [Coleofasciculus sp. FACHB-129]MBD1897985.1 hypothetical protein [Coleofasciculus sp. FACHB-129]
MSTLSSKANRQERTTQPSTERLMMQLRSPILRNFHETLTTPKKLKNTA